ncbi:ESCRT-II complex subunit-domain-containing protein, partial [Gorgonomyces haynaldii]
MQTFPPFYTQQPNSDTWQKQQELWTDLILQYCRDKNKFTISLEDEIFRNDQIKRKVSKSMFDLLMKHMKDKKRVIEDGVYLVLWRSVQEWANMLYDWAQTVGKMQIVLTKYEILEETDLNGMHDKLFLQVVQHLQKQSKANVFYVDGNMG